MFLTVKSLKPHQSPGLDCVREVIKSVLRVYVKQVNQHVERKSWEEEITLKKGLLNQFNSQLFSRLRGADFYQHCCSIIILKK